MPSVESFGKLLNELLIDGHIPTQYDYNFSKDATLPSGCPLISFSALLNMLLSISGEDTGGESQGFPDEENPLTELVEYILIESGFIERCGDVSASVFTIGVIIFYIISRLTNLFTAFNERILSYTLKGFHIITWFIMLVADKNGREDLKPPLVISQLFSAFYQLILDAKQKPEDIRALAVDLIQLWTSPFALVIDI